MIQCTKEDPIFQTLNHECRLSMTLKEGVLDTFLIMLDIKLAHNLRLTYNTIHNIKNELIQESGIINTLQIQIGFGGQFFPNTVLFMLERTQLEQN